MGLLCDVIHSQRILLNYIDCQIKSLEELLEIIEMKMLLLFIKFEKFCLYLYCSGFQQLNLFISTLDCIFLFNFVTTSLYLNVYPLVLQVSHLATN